jgi:hypothetical protein
VEHGSGHRMRLLSAITVGRDGWSATVQRVVRR